MTQAERDRAEKAVYYAANWVLPNTLSDAERHALAGAYLAGYEQALKDAEKLKE